MRKDAGVPKVLEFVEAEGCFLVFLIGMSIALCSLIFERFHGRCRRRSNEEVSGKADTLPKLLFQVSTQGAIVYRKEIIVESSKPPAALS